MKHLIAILYNPVLLIAAVMLLLQGCKEPLSQRLEMAERLMEERPDSAQVILDGIDYYWVRDSLRAQYIMCKAEAHALNNRSLVTDSMLPEAVAYYRTDGDSLRWLKSSLLYIMYLRDMGRIGEADSLAMGLAADVAAAGGISQRLKGDIVTDSAAQITPGDSSYHILVKELDRHRRVSADAVAEMNRLSAWKMQLSYEKQNIMLISLTVAFALSLIAASFFRMWRRRRARLIEAEERIETLDRMVRQANNEAASDKETVLKRMVLQQMGVLKTFASTPTAQSREALKRISNMGNKELDACKLVDWNNLYTMVDELFDGFHRKLLCVYPDLFTEKEIQIICLLRSDFSTKEIGFLTEQSSATIYVRKSSIRKKTATPESGDIIVQLLGKINSEEGKY